MAKKDGKKSRFGSLAMYSACHSLSCRRRAWSQQGVQASRNVALHTQVSSAEIGDSCLSPVSIQQEILKQAREDLSALIDNLITGRLG